MVACDGISDDVVPKQVDNIEKFLDNNNMEYSLQKGVYKHIGNIERSGYYNSPMIEKGDSVYFYIAGYKFNTTRIEPAFYSNKDFIIDDLRDKGLDAVYWPRTSQKVKLGKSSLVKGIENGLPGCRQGDSVRLFVPSDQAFGDDYMSTLPINSAVEFVLWIDKVIK